MARGGKRVGAGRPFGSKNKLPNEARELERLKKEAIRDRVREIVQANVDEMTRAQVEAAKGLSYLVGRDRKRGGKFVHLSAAKARAILQAGNRDRDVEVIEVWYKFPSTQAYTDLLDRAAGKAEQPGQEVSVTVFDEEAAMRELSAGRQRVFEARKKCEALKLVPKEASE